MKAKAVFIIVLLLVLFGLSAYRAIANTSFSKQNRFQEVLSEKEPTALVRELIEKMSGELEKNYEQFPELIHEIENYTRTVSDPATAALLHSLTAEMYLNYYHNNQRNIMLRTDLNGYEPADIREWTASLFERKIEEELNTSIAEPSYCSRHQPRDLPIFWI